MPATAASGRGAPRKLLGLSISGADLKGATTAFPECRATGASAVEQLRHLLNLGDVAARPPNGFQV